MGLCRGIQGAQEPRNPRAQVARNPGIEEAGNPGPGTQEPMWGGVAFIRQKGIFGVSCGCLWLHLGERFEHQNAYQKLMKKEAQTTPSRHTQIVVLLKQNNTFSSLEGVGGSSRELKKLPKYHQLVSKKPLKMHLQGSQKEGQNAALDVAQTDGFTEAKQLFWTLEGTSDGGCFSCFFLPHRCFVCMIEIVFSSANLGAPLGTCSTAPDT